MSLTIQPSSVARSYTSVPSTQSSSTSSNSTSSAPKSLFISSEAGSPGSVEEPIAQLVCDPPSDASASRAPEHAPEQQTEDRGFWDVVGDALGTAVDKFGGQIGAWAVDEGKKLLGLDAKQAGQAGTHGAAAANASDGARQPTAPPTGAAPTGFEALVGEVLAPNAQGLVNEEELFAALVYERVTRLAGAPAGEAYKAAIQGSMSALVRPDGSVPLERAAVDALKKLVADGVLTKEQGDAVYSQAFEGAQLDRDAQNLFDDRGGPNDATVATAQFGDALASARQRIAAFDAGQATPAARSLADATATGVVEPARASRRRSGAQRRREPGARRSKQVDGPGGFVYKPISGSDGKLVVLIPGDLGDVRRMTLRDPKGKVIEEGRDVGRTNGDRPTFRFQEPGEAYPDGSTVEVELADGTTRRWTIEESSVRAD